MKKLLCLLTSYLIFQNAYVQVNDHYWRKLYMQPYNFPAITDTFENYLFSQYPDSIPDSSFKNIKDYYRFCYYWGSRLGVVNDSLSYDPYQIAAINNLADPYCSENDPAQWEILGPVTLPTQNLGLVSEVLDDPNVEDSYLISTEHGGLWKSQSTGNSWVNVTDNLRLPGISATEIIRNPFDSNHIIASTGGGRSGTSYGMGIIESFDNGETWSIMEGFPFQSAPKIVRVIVDPNDTDPNDGLTLYAIGLKKIYKSANTGIDWEEIANPPTLKNYTQFADIEVNSCNQILVTTSANYNQIDGQVFIFYNNTWTEISDQFIDFETGKLSTPNNDKIFIVCDGSDRKIYKSINGGNDWTLINMSIGKDK